LTLIKSISGIRGTIGGLPGDNLTPFDIVEFAAAFGSWVLRSNKKAKIVIGRDGRISGNMLSNLVSNTLIALGIDVVDLGLSTTPTVEIAVPLEKAGAGIVLTASHNPKEWNALKFLNEKGEFISASDGEEVLQILKNKDSVFARVDKLGKIESNDHYIKKHIQKILDLDLVDANLIQQSKFRVVVDCINSTGALAIPPLLDALGIQFELINSEINGDFAHNPEPLAIHLTALSQKVIKSGAHAGISIDPDVDRLAFVCEDGEMFGEEYTLVAIADYILKNTPGPAVSNLSSTRALRDVVEKYGQRYAAAAVGEVNVVQKMKSIDAIIGGEGNGGVIYPALHYGRDALVGIALFFTHLASMGLRMTELKAGYPAYTIEKQKIELHPGMDPEAILMALKEQYKDAETDLTDGLKIYLEKEWVHLRKSNTEAIIRIYAESQNSASANALAKRFIKEIKKII
jgi:phosphomannomutase